MARRIPIKVGETWIKNEMSGKVVTMNEAARAAQMVAEQDNGLEKNVIAQASQEADEELKRQADALRDVSIKAIDQAAGPTPAPTDSPLAATAGAPSRRLKSNSSSSSSSVSGSRINTSPSSPSSGKSHGRSTTRASSTRAKTQVTVYRLNPVR